MDDNRQFESASNPAELDEPALDEVAGGKVSKPVKLGPDSSDPETGGEGKAI